jgi:hypothetical protein
MKPSLFLSLYFVGLLLHAPAQAYTLELTEQEILEKISARMPIEKNKKFFSVIMQNPDINLQKKSDQFGFKIDIILHSKIGLSAQGSAYMEGELAYDDTLGEFYLINSRIQTMEIKNTPEKYQQKVLNIANYMAEHHFSKILLYRLKDEDLKQQLVKSTLKSAKINNGKLELELSPFD